VIFSVNEIAIRCICLLFMFMLFPTLTSAFQVAPALLNMSAQSGRQPQPRPTTLPPAGTLTLEEVLQQVETHHPKLRGAQAERELASAKRLEKQGAFDPVINFGTGFLQYNSTSKRGSALNASANDVELEYLTRSGIKIFAGSRYNYGTIKSPLSSTGDGGEYYIGIKVPLMPM
jgi:outer membrane protein